MQQYSKIFCLVALLCSLTFEHALADPQDGFPPPYPRRTRERVAEPYNYSGTNTQEQTTNIQVQQPDVPPPNLLLPDQNIQPTRSVSNSPQKKFKPWEYEKTDDNVVRELQESIDDAYLQGRMRANPLSPKRIRELRSDSLATEEAMQPPTPTTGISRFKPISLQPGSKIPDVFCFPGTTTTIRFLDSTGAPWPILSYVLGNGQAFTVQKAGNETEHASNILVVTPNKSFADTSLAVTLAPDVPTVLFLHATVKNKKPDYLVTFRTDMAGPNAKSEIVRDEKNALVSELMLSFLDGIPPKGAKRMRVSGDLKAWEYEGKVFVRTNQTLIWPAYKSIVRASGKHPMRVYELPKVSSVVLDIAGKPKRMSLQSGSDMSDWENKIRSEHSEQEKQ